MILAVFVKGDYGDTGDYREPIEALDGSLL
jgi:hypothetical protein